MTTYWVKAKRHDGGEVNIPSVNDCDLDNTLNKFNDTAIYKSVNFGRN
jgi:hypothetical protein